MLNELIMKKLALFGCTCLLVAHSVKAGGQITTKKPFYKLFSNCSKTVLTLFSNCAHQIQRVYLIGVAPVRQGQGESQRVRRDAVRRRRQENQAGGAAQERRAARVAAAHGGALHVESS